MSGGLEKLLEICSSLAAEGSDSPSRSQELSWSSRLTWSHPAGTPENQIKLRAAVAMKAQKVQSWTHLLIGHNEGQQGDGLPCSWRHLQYSMTLKRRHNTVTSPSPVSFPGLWKYRTTFPRNPSNTRVKEAHLCVQGPLQLQHVGVLLRIDVIIRKIHQQTFYVQPATKQQTDWIKQPNADTRKHFNRRKTFLC